MPSQNFSINYLKNPDSKSDTAVFTVFSDTDLCGDARELDEKTDGLITRVTNSKSGFKGKHKQAAHIDLPETSGFKHAIILGLGEEKEFSHAKAEDVGGTLFDTLKKLKSQNATFFADDVMYPENILAGLCLKSYEFKKYKTSKNDEDEDKTETKFKLINVIAEQHAYIRNDFERLNAVVEGTFFARDLVNEPPNELYPDAFAQKLHTELKPLGVDVEIFDEPRLEKHGMKAIMAVGKGSARPPRLVVMRWQGLGKNYAKQDALAFVGKGVTFDTGGISIKPASGMDEMKMDMGGAAAVAGLMKSLALREAKADVIGIVGLAENMPSAGAYRPGDIIGSHAGKTIEVLNTDAEGRLVLADAISYAQDTYKPKMIIDLATLTGAMMVALGHEYCGTFVNNDDLWANLEKASEKTGEKLWRMPLDPVWKKDMESDIADLQNLGKSGRYGGACTAAGFLEHFIKDDETPWAHLDIAGTAWIKKDKPTVPKSATGFGVRLLDALVEDAYE